MKVKQESFISLRRLFSFILLFIFASLILACSDRRSRITSAEAITVILIADGDSSEITTEASSVREFLQLQDIDLSDADQVDPPLFTPLSNGMEIVVLRVTESIEIIESTIPFQRRTVRNEAMSTEDAPVIVQAGQAGLQETTLRIIFHNGVEFSRQETQVTITKPAQDEIVMIGVGVAPGSIEFPGLLAFISGGNSVLMRGTSAVPVQIDTGHNLDQRVFSLSPDGSKLLYTKISTETNRFNSLWVIGTEPNAIAHPLGIDNVLWADWNPALVATPEIAFTTGTPTDLLPGWEANNDLWIASIPSNRLRSVQPSRLVEAYPVIYSWWGGNYAWSPDGRYIAYSYADQVGILDIRTSNETGLRRQLQSFTEFNTGADWVWVPSLAWSPDSDYLVFTRHSGDDPDDLGFDTWVTSISGNVDQSFVAQSGIWSHPHWSPSRLDNSRETGLSEIAFLRATNPLESQQSSYTLWRMDRDGSNARQLYPPAGENSRFPKDREFMVWGPTAKEMVFVYDNQLFLFDLTTNVAKRLTHSDLEASNPTWAPYGIGRFSGLAAQEEDPFEFLTPGPVRGVIPVE